MNRTQVANAARSLVHHVMIRAELLAVPRPELSWVCYLAGGGTWAGKAPQQLGLEAA